TLVLNPALITQDYDLLRFSAAASLQLPPAHTTPDPADPTTYSTSLISSPYNVPGHYLDLSSLSTPSLLLALALTTLAPARPDYATAPYTEALNFPIVFSTLRSLITTTRLPFPASSFYVVTFHSTLHPTASQPLLHTLDFESHREACESGGLLKYWFGKADLGGDRRNLATCFWAGREEARRGGRGEWHAKARRAGGELYEGIVFGTWRLWVGEGGRGWGLEAWED
ncbi:hypothetical protein C7974DRAFT_326825, partial [Boeremia exigua]|uniref:uncharacterized protein n=1 Tax=Boeremia exigua TaxID=749465 RepID=UPI001E8D01EA